MLVRFLSRYARNIQIFFLDAHSFCKDCVAKYARTAATQKVFLKISFHAIISIARNN